ncbi:MAG: HAMP domain-containing sensor histidine kinase, partial [Pseudomonadota bacterium]
VRAKYQSILSSNKIRVSIAAPPRLVMNCMEVSIFRAIDNCMKNSIRHLKTKTHTKRQITLGARSVLTSGRVTVELWVHDNGMGIERALLPKVQKPFVSYSSGMGLGLAIVSTVCEIHGGSVDITSDWGAWTRVTMSFPQ